MKNKLQVHKTLEPQARNLFFFEKSEKEDSMKKNNHLRKEAAFLQLKMKKSLTRARSLQIQTSSTRGTNYKNRGDFV